MASEHERLAPEDLRTRCEPPTLEEAIFAAQGLAADIDGQTEIAVMLMGVPQAEVGLSILKVAAAWPQALNLKQVSVRPSTGRPIVIVEKALACFGQVTALH